MPLPPRFLAPVLLGAAALAAAVAPPRSSEARADEAARPAPPEVAARLDAVLAAAWKRSGVRPARAAEDAELLRRASLDLTGAIPQEETVAAFLRQRGKDKRPRLIQALLHSRGYARHMARRWANLLVGRSRLLEQGERPALVRWLEQQLAANTRWDVVVRALVAAEGAVEENGAVEYLLRYEGRPEEMAGNAMRVFQGQQVQCAQCHDHPYQERWKQRDFWQLTAFFARARPRQEGMQRALVEDERGEARLPGLPGAPGPVVEPVFITGESIDPGEGAYRREELARILTSPKNPWFARATVNRVWSFFFGAGFSDPDDLAVPSHPEVVDLLTEDFVASGYDLKRLCQVILTSDAYQRTSTGPDAERDAQVEAFARARLRPLSPEQLWWSFVEATDLEAALARLPGEEGAQRRQYLRRRFFTVFAGTEDGGLDAHTITQALHLLNGALPNDALRAGPAASPLLERLLALQSDDDRVTALFLRALGRPATKAERRAFRSGGLSSEEQALLLQDLLWALLNSSEFLYNH